MEITCVPYARMAHADTVVVAAFNKLYLELRRQALSRLCMDPPPARLWPFRQILSTQVALPAAGFYALSISPVRCLWLFH